MSKSRFGSQIPMMAPLKVGPIRIAVLGLGPGKLVSGRCSACSHWRYKTIAMARDGLDNWIHPVSPRQNLSQSRDVHGQVHFFDRCAGPHLPEQVVLAHQMSAVSNKMHQQVECLRRDGYRLAATQQQTFPGGEPEISKL